MRALEAIAGFFIGLITLLILLFGAFVAVGSIRRYLKNESM
jgi:hypothetical protein